MPTSDELMGTFPGGNQYTTDRPLGVPEGYEVPRQSTGIFDRIANLGAPPKPPTFMEGDDWKPARQSPEAIARVQQQLVNAGLLDGTYRIGLWDEKTRQAYRGVLQWANASGVDDDAEALDYLVQTRAQFGEPAQERAPLLAQVSNPLDVRRTAEDVVIDRLGSLQPGLADQITSGYRQQELAAQQSQYDMGETGGTVVTPPSVEAYAEDQARRADPTGFDAHEALTGFDMLSQLMGGA